MDIKTKFNLDDKVYTISAKRSAIEVPTNCPVCKDSKKIMIKNKEYMCPECGGQGSRWDYGNWLWSVSSDQGKIGGINAELYSSFYEGEYGNESKITYMLNKIGVEYRNTWREKDLFSNKEEAQLECDKRNEETSNKTPE